MAYQELSLRQFEKKYSTDRAREKTLETARWRNGFVCPKRAHTKASQITTKSLLQYSRCHRNVQVPFRPKCGASPGV